MPLSQFKKPSNTARRHLVNTKANLLKLSQEKQELATERSRAATKVVKHRIYADGVPELQPWVGAPAPTLGKKRLTIPETPKVLAKRQLNVYSKITFVSI